jgi:hypothetical protein
VTVPLACLAFLLLLLLRMPTVSALSGNADAASDSRLGTESCRVNDR